MYTKLLEEKDIISRSRKSFEDIQKICEAGDAFTRLGHHRDPVQTLLLRRGSNGDGLIMPIVEAAAIQAEKKSAGAGSLFLKIISNSMIEDIARKSIGLDPDDEWDIILEAINRFSVPARRNDMDKIFGTGSETYQKIISGIFDTIKAGDSVLVKKSAQIQTRISRESGFSFTGLEVDNRFFQKGIWVRKNVRTFLIDGIIEKISEIHHLLESLSQTRSPGAIFCLDCLPEVMETLVKNYMLGNLDVMLVKVPVTEFHVNTIVDLGRIFETEPIASARGETISTGVMRQDAACDRVTISRGNVVIERQKARDSVNKHLESLRIRLDENINLAPLLETRIRSLTTSVTRVDVGMNDQKIDPGIVESLDRTLRSLPRFFKSGFIEKNDFKEFSSSKICLLFERKDEIPAEMAHQAIKIFLSTRSAIRSAASGIESV